MQITWANILEDLYGVRLDKEKVSRWIVLIQEPDAVGDISEAELCEVLRWVRKKREGDQRRQRPTLETLIGWVKWYRKEQAAARRGWRHDTDEGIIGLCKSAMLKAKTNFDRWNIMCDPNIYADAHRSTTVDECRELETWAQSRWPEFEMPTFTELTGEVVRAT
jgi:hypothetical protein